MAYDYEKSLVSRWDMSTINPVDLGFRGLGNNGVGTGLVAATDIVQGRTSMATEFDGTEYVTLTTPTSLQIPLPISVAMWVKPSAAGTNRGLFENDVTASGYGVSGYIGVTNLVTVTFFDGTGVAATDRRRKIGTTALVVGRWYHVVCVFQGAVNMQIYINGVDDLGVYTDTGGALAYSGGNGMIGSYSNLRMNGVLDDVRIYDTVLTGIDVADLYARSRRGATGG